MIAHIFMTPYKNKDFLKISCLNCSDCLLPVSTHLLSVLLPGEECSRHEEAVQTSEVQPAEGGKPREQGQQGSLCYAASRQGQALQFRAQAKAHLRRKQHKTGRLAKVCVCLVGNSVLTRSHTQTHMIVISMNY